MSTGFVAVFDSGVGGVSVLRELVRELPYERFCYFGDSANAPYGERTEEEVCQLSLDIASSMIADGAKAIVIACNTATSAAAPTLRERWPEVPIVGVEPALKPAVLAAPSGRVLVMATPMTVRLDKFQHLLERWGSRAQVTAVACEGLAGRIEQGRLDDPDLTNLIESLVGEYAGEVDALVLGCTHYPFVRRQILSVLGEVPCFDGAVGTARQLRRRLMESGLLAPQGSEGSVELRSSKDTPEELALYQDFYHMPITRD